MFETLMAKAEGLAQRRVRAVRHRLLTTVVPDGVAVVRVDSGISLSGRSLRMRFITDVRLRSFADLVRRRLP